MMPYKVSFSIVLYRHPIQELQAVLASVLLYKGEKRIFLIDNSPTREAEGLTQLDNSIQYVFNGRNAGFGQGHNRGLELAARYGSKYHFVLNPDITYHKDVVAQMLDFMEQHEDVAQLMPCILYPDGRPQYLPKLCPTPQFLFWRQLKHPYATHERRMERFEMRAMRNDRTYDVACISGCFSALRMSAVQEVGGYDKRYFMYFEDTDLTRRLHRRFRTVYFPMVSVHHAYGHGAAKNPRLFLNFVCSCIKYFCKWGWFFDNERRAFNKEVLRQVEVSKK